MSSRTRARILDIAKGVDVKDSAAWLQAKGPAWVIVTLGAEGCLLSTHKGAWNFAARPVKASDTSGAGDVFSGVLVGSLARGASLDDAIQAGQRAAALTVERNRDVQRDSIGGRNAGHRSIAGIYGNLKGPLRVGKGPANASNMQFYLLSHMPVARRPGRRMRSVQSGALLCQKTHKNLTSIPPDDKSAGSRPRPCAIS